MLYNKNAGYGQSLMNFARTVCPTFGNILVVMNSSNSDEANYQKVQEVFGPDPQGLVRFYTSLESAYAAAESNNNDIILLDGNSTHKVAAAIAWSKNRIHVFGMDGGGRLFAQGAKVESTIAAGDAYVMAVTGTRNTFENIKFIQADTDAAAITCVQDGGEGTVFRNCSFVFGTATNLDGTETTSYEFVAGGDSCLYENCLFGTSTLAGDGARAVMAIDAISGGSATVKDNVWKDCFWTISSETASADMIRLIGTDSAQYTNTWINPVFHAVVNAAASSIVLDDTVRSYASQVAGELLFVNPASNCTEFCTDVTDLVKVIGHSMLTFSGADPTVAAAALVGTAITPA